MLDQRKILDAFPALRSSNVAEIEHTLSAIYGSRRFELLGSQKTLAVHANHWQSQAISLSFCHYGARADVEFPEAGFFRQLFPLRGGAEVKFGGCTHEVSGDRFCVVPADRPLLIKFRPEYEQLVLRVDQTALERKLAALHGSLPGKKLEFALSEHAGNSRMARLFRLLKYLISELDRNEQMTEIEISELEQAVLVAFLQASPHEMNALSASCADLGSWQLRMVEDYIQEHWNEPLTLESLSGATSVGARSIFHHFRKFRGKTPMEYVKQVRLNHARQLLINFPDLSVTEVAASCGFGNLGHFAVDYRRYWGERPSYTRARCRRNF